MTTILNLFILAVQLITIATGTGYSQTEINDAIAKADRALACANQVVQTQAVQNTPTTTQTPTQPDTFTQPVLGGNIQVMDKSEIVIEKQEYVEPTSEYPKGYFAFKVGATKPNGDYIKFALISLNSDDNVMGKVTTSDANSHSSLIVDNWTAALQYVPTTPGIKTLTFTSGNLTKTITVEVK